MVDKILRTRAAIAVQNGIRAKLGIDATIPFDEKARSRRCACAPVEVDGESLSYDPRAFRTATSLQGAWF